MITKQQIKENDQIKIYIEQADKSMAALGFTEHSFAHVPKVAHYAQQILLD